MVTGSKFPEWVLVWGKDNLLQLNECSNDMLALHPSHGLIFNASAGRMFELQCLLRRSVLKDVYYANAEELRETVVHANQPTALDPIEVQPKWVDHDNRLQIVARRLGKRATNVLLKVLSWGERDGQAPVNINTQLTPDEVQRLYDEYRAEDNRLPDNAKTSPHPQPPPSPQVDPFNNDVVIDGSVASWFQHIKLD